jgi:hypothetical protein
MIAGIDEAHLALCRIFERSAAGPLPPDAPPPPSVRVFLRRGLKLLAWKVQGLARPSPFFDDRTRAPLSKPRVLARSGAARPLERPG